MISWKAVKPLFSYDEMLYMHFIRSYMIKFVYKFWCQVFRGSRPEVFCEKAALKNFFQNSKKKARLLLIIRLKKGEIRKTVGSLTNSLLWNLWFLIKYCLGENVMKNFDPLELPPKYYSSGICLILFRFF